jgi:hypothetical protein
MALLTLEGIYRDGKVELAEEPADVGDETRVLVTFLPATAKEMGTASPYSPDEQEHAEVLNRLIDRMRKGFHLGGGRLPTREEIYAERLDRFG